MIEKINGFQKSYIPFTSGKQNAVPETKTAQDVFTDNKKSQDVKYNFTFKVNDTGVGSVHLFNGKSKISGKSYGLDYEIERKGNRNLMELTGKIGDKPVNIKYKSKGLFSLYSDIEGYVGEKKINIQEKRLLASSKLKGTFGNEEIKFSFENMRNDTLIKGQGIDMSLMYYASQPNHGSKYVGQYNLDPEFLPVFAALYRYS